MPLRMIPLQEKLAFVERAIAQTRRRGGQIDVSADEAGILAEIAKDLRARLASAPTAAEEELRRALVIVERSRTHNGYEAKSLVGLAEKFIAIWPVIQLALQEQGR